MLFGNIGELTAIIYDVHTHPRVIKEFGDLTQIYYPKKLQGEIYVNLIAVMQRLFRFQDEFKIPQVLYRHTAKPVISIAPR